jgi:dehydrogenase/reductase SDR family protein 7B
MIKHKSGQIVGVTSVGGKITTGYRGSYSGAKSAFISILDCLRTEMKPFNIRVCNIMPGYIRTNLSKNAMVGGVG